MPPTQSMLKVYLWMQVSGKSPISLDHSKDSKLFALFLGRRSQVRKSFSVSLILNLLNKQRSSLTPFKDIDLIEMIFWDCNFLMPPSTTSIKPIKLNLPMILITKTILILEETISKIHQPKVVVTTVQLVSLMIIQNLVSQVLQLIRVLHLVKIIKIVLVNLFK